MRIAVVIPCYKVTDHILSVLELIGESVERIYVVDDSCPDQSGQLVLEKSPDPRVQVIFHETNQGVGGAVLSGYRQALKDGMEVILKLDGDGQMDPSLIPQFVKPISDGLADYTKGNRFDSLENLLGMPRARILGNAILSLFTKFSSGYWSITDPTNGFTAIHRKALQSLNLNKIRRSYFFESDMLFRLSIANCVVWDIPMAANYGAEKSNLRIRRVITEFPWRHFINMNKRVFYKYYLREWNIGSFELPIGLCLALFGVWFGGVSYQRATEAGIATTAGQVTTSALGLILGLQLLLSFISYDVESEPKIPKQIRSFDA